MIRGVALGLTLFVTLLLTGCGIVVTDEAPTDALQVSAPSLVEAYTEVEALAAPARTLSLRRARQVARKAALRVVVPSCDDDSRGRGFALDAHTLVAHRDVVPGGGWVRVWTANRRSTAVGAGSAYRVGELGVARVARTLPRRLPLARSVAAGASVVVVTERDGKLRLLPGVHRRQRPGEGVRRPDDGAAADVGRPRGRRRPGARREGAPRRGRVWGRRADDTRAGGSCVRTARAWGCAHARGARRLRRLTDRRA